MAGLPKEKSRLMARLTVRLLGAAVAAVLAMSVSALAHDPAPRQAVAQAARARAEQLTVDLVRINAKHDVANAGQKRQLEQTLLSAAVTRAQELRGLMESDPGTVLRLAIPARIRASLPPSVRQHVEEDADVEGILEVLHEDGVAGGRFLYQLETAAGRLAVHFAGDGPDNVLSGSRVRVRGTRLDLMLAAADAGSGSVQADTLALSHTFGAQATLVILVNFTDKPTRPYTVDHARSVVFTTARDFYREGSYGQTWLTGDVAGWYTIPMSSTTCDHNALATHARQAAAAAGVNVGNYRRHVFGFPENACPWWGMGSVGGTPSRAWVNGRFEFSVIGHELGHNLGLYHSHSYDCGATVLGASCTVTDYGDTLDLMGVAPSAHFNSFQKERLGWLNYGSSPPLHTVTTSGTYTIDAYETGTPNAKGVKVLQGLDPSTGKTTWYYFEYRQGIGFDGFVASSANVQNGLVVHLGTEGAGNSSYLLDMTPVTSSWSDPAIAVGQTFSDPAAGVTVTPVWTDSTGAGVSVAFAGQACVRAAPTVALSPSQSQWLPAGATASFTATIRNNDNEGCAATTFTLQPVVPGGWAGVVGGPALAVAPGAIVSAPVAVTSAASAPDGFYVVGVDVRGVGDPAHVGSASATYAVITEPAPPSRRVGGAVLRPR
jgi:hypothetical protein